MINRTINGAPMNIINANDLKVGGVTAIEAALEGEREVSISVRGERRFVVMGVEQYQYLRECELEAAWLATQADRVEGRARNMSAAQHKAELEKRLKKPAAALTVQQERARYGATKTDISTSKTTSKTAPRKAGKIR